METVATQWAAISVPCTAATHTEACMEADTDSGDMDTVIPATDTNTVSLLLYFFNKFVICYTCICSIDDVLLSSVCATCFALLV